MFHVSTVVFDLDGTLIDTAPDLHAATNHVLKSVGRPLLTLNEVRHMVGRGARALIERGLLATGGMGDLDQDQLLGLFLEYYGNNIARGSKPFEGAENMLKALRASGVTCLLCTNKPEHLARQLMTELDLLHHFAGLTGGDTFAFRKPDPRHIQYTLQQNDRTGPALMIGDSASDIDGANALGIPSVAVSFGYTDTPAAELGATLTIDHLSELPALIQKAP